MTTIIRSHKQSLIVRSETKRGGFLNEKALLRKVMAKM
jgi:hypothetical protein